VFNNTNYNKFIHIIIQFVHKNQIQLLTLSHIKTFLSFAAHVVFHTVSSAGGRNIHKTLFIDVKLFHQYIKSERNQVWLTKSKRNKIHTKVIIKVQRALCGDVKNILIKIPHLK